ncbi:UNVERIFIED_ORG: hypothetical protein M2328_006736 [Rhodococcus erythropolis]
MPSSTKAWGLIGWMSSAPQGVGALKVLRPDFKFPSGRARIGFKTCGYRTGYPIHFAVFGYPYG